MTEPSTATPTPMNFENIPDGEDVWRAEIAQMTVALQDKRKAAQNGEVLRGVHPKSHGCLDAEFTVNKDLPCDLKVGLFKDAGRAFRAKIRYSNADVLKRADIEKATGADGNTTVESGSRGMAVKILDVDGPVLLQDGEASNQDFLMINTPEFAFRNVRDYKRLTQALLASENGAEPDLFFLPLKLLEAGVLDGEGKLRPAAPDEPATVAKMRAIFENSGVFAEYGAQDVAGVMSAFAVVQQIKAALVRNPLEAPYFTAAPFRFGPDRVAKFAVAPVGGARPADPLSAEEIAKIEDDYLAAAVIEAMAGTDTITLSFLAQIASAAEVEGKVDTMIENASVGWDIEPVELARITIRPCDQPTPLVDACKPLLFTPWHALPAHEPLGGINRLRKPVYSDSAAFRRQSYADAAPDCA